MEILEAMVKAWWFFVATCASIVVIVGAAYYWHEQYAINWDALKFWEK